MRLLLIASVLILFACSDSDNGNTDGVEEIPSDCVTGSPVADALSFEAAFGGEKFSSPLKLVQHPTIDDRFYVVEQLGTVTTLLQSDPVATRSEAIDLGNSVNLVSGGERGLLGMAFDPAFGANGEVFFSYNESTAAGFDSVIGRFTSPDLGITFVPSAMDPTIFAVPQPASNHNGGDINFGPDGFLYFSLGDGGGGGDPFENGQDTTTLLGSILRIDPSTTPAGIPADNPFVGTSAAEEIYAFGLRNPWRMSFDSVTGELWVGDVGQNQQEEIDRIVAGGNYGWDCFEGILDFEMDAGCVAGPIRPEVVHDHPSFQSITGGYVYRGSKIPALQGAYVYGDFVSGEVCAYFFDETPKRLVSLSPPAGLNISSFGEDRAGELYVIDYFGSPSIYRIVPAL